MKKSLFAIIVCGLSMSVHAEFQGDQKDACEAILCLSSSATQRPSECAAPINRYYSIKRKKWGDTVQARKDFLNQCPLGSQAGADVADLKNKLAESKSECSAQVLNVINQELRKKWVCDKSNECRAVTYTVISSVLPRGCVALATTIARGSVAEYVGDPEKGGLWANQDEYDAVLRKYQAALQSKESQ